jgi:hypothetical protein
VNITLIFLLRDVGGQLLKAAMNEPDARSLVLRRKRDCHQRRRIPCPPAYRLLRPRESQFVGRIIRDDLAEHDISRIAFIHIEDNFAACFRLILARTQPIFHAVARRHLIPDRLRRRLDDRFLIHCQLLLNVH